MSPRELIALVRRHVIAVAVVLLVAGGTAYTFKHTPPTYTESGTVVLTMPKPNSYTVSYGTTMINTAEIAVNWLKGVTGQREARQAGVTNSFDVALVNFSNQEYPYYAVPYITISASAQDPATAHQQFTTVTRILNDYLALHQRQDGVSRYYWISASVNGDTGPLLQQGSRIRTFAGLLVLTIVTIYVVAAFLDRHPIRPRTILRSWWHDSRNPFSRDPVTGPTQRRAT